MRQVVHEAPLWVLTFCIILQTHVIGKLRQRVETLERFLLEGSRQ